MNTGYSGKFVVRLPPELHQELAHEARSQKRSLNLVCLNLLSVGLRQEKAGGGRSERYQAVIPLAQKKFGRDLLTLAIFGSQVSGEATPLSDLDFLVVLSRQVPITRSLYRWWDEEVKVPEDEVWNPQFVTLPRSPEEAGGLWLEVAMAQKILWERGQVVSKFLGRLKKTIAKNEVRRYWSNGQPYWVKA